MVLTLTGSPNGDAPAVAHAIESDAALASRVLRLLNRLAFGLRSRCSSIRRALRDRYPARAARVQAHAQSTQPSRAGPISRMPAEEDVCAFCDNAAFGVQCTICDILLCQGHRMGSGAAVCERCEDLFRHELAEQRVLDLPMSLIVIGAAIGFALLAAAARGYAWGAALFALGLFAWAAHNLRRRLQLRRAFLSAPNTSSAPPASLYPPRPSNAPRP